MQRRLFLKKAIATAGSAGIGGRLPRMLFAGPAESITRVLLITKCHLDVGFTATQARVKEQYFEEYFPTAMRTAAQLRAGGDDRYTWTTGSWLLYEYLEQSSAETRKQVEAAIAAKDLSWHALPFSWETEMLDRSMIEGGLAFSRILDERFGRRTIAAKMTDVPGHTRGLIRPLNDAGIRLLDIGVNAASTPPDVPDLFLWKNAAGDSLPVMYHRHDYGSSVGVPGTGVVISVVVRGDNSGPHTPKEIASLYNDLRQQFPGAAIEAASLSDAALVVDRVRDRLPVVTGEIGDTWIYGVASDPEKVSAFRAAARLRQKWIAQRRFSVGDATDVLLLRRLLLAAEHTWGTDTKTYLDTDHYLEPDLHSMLGEPGYRTMEKSWQEKRDNINEALTSLPAKFQTEVKVLTQRSTILAPSSTGMRPLASGESLRTKHFEIEIDPRTGAITRLTNRATGHQIASSNRPLALLTYQTLSAARYASFLERYIKTKADWAPRDFGKPGIERFGATDREWHPQVVGGWTSSSATEDRLVVQLAFAHGDTNAVPRAVWPKQMFLDIRFPVGAPEMELGVTLLEKGSNRMPEALWLTFQPILNHPFRLVFDKSGEPVEWNETVQGGGRAMHAVSGSVRYLQALGNLEIESLDTAMVAVGERSPLNFSLQLPGVEDGIHFGLFNNAWGTNYPQWCGGSWTYKFAIKLST